MKVTLIGKISEETRMFLEKKWKGARKIEKKNEYRKILNAKEGEEFEVNCLNKNNDLKKIGEEFRIIDGRSYAKQKEDNGLDEILKNIEEKTNLGNKMRENYESLFEKTIDTVEKVGSNRDHYDLLIKHTDGTENQCEVKSTQKIIKIHKDTVPWCYSCQCRNIPGKQLSISEKYSKHAHENIFQKVNWSDLYDVHSPLLTADELKEEFYRINPKTPFLQELKKISREKPLNGRKGGADLRKLCNPTFVFTDEDKATFIEEVQPMMNENFNEKHCFLQTSGDPKEPSTFEFMWKRKIEPPTIVDVEIITEKSDIEFVFKTSPDWKCQYDWKPKGKLRWGKGCLIANLRLDIL